MVSQSVVLVVFPVQVSNYQENAQPERNSHSKNRGGKKTTSKLALRKHIVGCNYGLVFVFTVKEWMHFISKSTCVHNFTLLHTRPRVVFFVVLHVFVLCFGVDF